MLKPEREGSGGGRVQGRVLGQALGGHRGSRHAWPEGASGSLLRPSAVYVIPQFLFHHAVYRGKSPWRCVVLLAKVTCMLMTLNSEQSFSDGVHSSCSIQLVPSAPGSSSPTPLVCGLLKYCVVKFILYISSSQHIYASAKLQGSRPMA